MSTLVFSLGVCRLGAPPLRHPPARIFDDRTRTQRDTGRTRLFLPSIPSAAHGSSVRMAADDAVTVARRLVSWAPAERADLRGAFLHEAAVRRVYKGGVQATR